MTGRGNNTYLIAGAGTAALVDAGVGAAAHLADIEGHLDTMQSRLDLVLVTHAHADHAHGAPALARAHASAAFAKFPWPEEDARHGVAWQPLEDGQIVEAGGER